ncbi:glycine cleavage H-protein-domain-containing protein [Amylostereum chailletii]|nr:glycine cleavage H-protein-domain-containing protein [Amylostereum chailletii]
MLSSLRQVSRSAGTLRAARMQPRPMSFAFTRSLVTQKYSTDHESVKYDDETGIGTVTITEFAQTSLGDVVFVELPEKGRTIEKGDTIGAVESVKAASDVYSPVSGEVVAINETLGDQPSLLNKSPEDKGWLFQVKLSNPAELDELMTAEKYKEHCSS